MRVAINGFGRIGKLVLRSFIERKVKHRLENPFKKPLEMIEVQIGDEISEEDIERFDDLYDRME